MKKYFTLTNFVFFALFSVAIIARFLFIDRFPPGMQHDELEYAMSSKTYQLFGYDLSGTSFPNSLISTKTHGSISPIPPIVLSPLWNILPTNMETVRLAYTFVNLISAILLGLMTFILFRKKALSIITVLVFLLNPWSTFYARQAIDAPFALLFFLLGICIIIAQKRYWTVFSIIAFFLGFFSYNGAKLLLLPVVIISLVYLFITNKTKKGILMGYFISAVIFFSAYLIISNMAGESVYNQRSSEMIPLNKEHINYEVGFQRQTTVNTPLNNIFINKISFSVYSVFKQYLGAFSPVLLFMSAEVWNRMGFFFFIDIVLLILGIMFMIRKYISQFTFLLSLLLVAPIITAISMNGQSIINRGFLMLPIIIIFVAYGLHQMYLFLKKKFPASLVIISIGTTYIVFFFWYLFIFYFQIPITNHGFYQVGTRVLARYLDIEKEQRSSIVVISQQPREEFLEVTFFSNKKTQEDILRTNQTLNEQKQYTIDNIEFIASCPEKYDPQTQYIISKDFPDCFPKLKHQYLILDQMDAGTVFRISGSSTCKEYSTSRWRGTHLISDYAIESLPIQAFCDRWIAKEIILAGENEE